MLRATITLHISWRQHPTKLQFRGLIPDISTILRERRMRFAGHCWLARERSTALVTYWTMVKGRLVALQSPTSINSLETRNAFRRTSLLCCRTLMDGVMDSRMTELARPDDDDEILNQKWPSEKLAGVIQFPSTLRISISSLSNATGQFVLFGCTKNAMRIF